MTKPKQKKKEHRSSLETLVHFLLQGCGIKAGYEDTVLKYTQPETPRRYNPDFRIPANTLFQGSPEVFLETKGQLTSSDRKKHKLIKEQYPELLLILIFGRSQNRLNKKSNTTYADWADKYNIPWLDVKDLQKKGDIKKCLLSIIPKQRTGKSKIQRKKKSEALSQLENAL